MWSGHPEKRGCVCPACLHRTQRTEPTWNLRPNGPLCQALLWVAAAGGGRGRGAGRVRSPATAVAGPDPRETTAGGQQRQRRPGAQKAGAEPKLEKGAEFAARDTLAERGVLGDARESRFQKQGRGPLKTDIGAGGDIGLVSGRAEAQDEPRTSPGRNSRIPRGRDEAVGEGRPRGRPGERGTRTAQETDRRLGGPREPGPRRGAVPS